MEQGLTPPSDIEVISRYRRGAWLLGPVGFLAVCVVFAMLPYGLGYDHLGDFVRQNSHGVAWAIAMVCVIPCLFGVAVLLAIAPLRSKGVAIRAVGEIIVFTGPVDLTVAKSLIQDVLVIEGKASLNVVIDGASRWIGVPFLDASPVELRRRLLVAVGRSEQI